MATEDHDFDESIILISKEKISLNGALTRREIIRTKDQTKFLKLLAVSWVLAKKCRRIETI
jgi:hypothetical protein